MYLGMYCAMLDGLTSSQHSTFRLATSSSVETVHSTHEHFEHDQGHVKYLLCRDLELAVARRSRPGHSRQGAAD